MEIKLGKSYTGIGYSGMSEGVVVSGVLVEMNKQHDHAILMNDFRVYAVKYKSLRPLEKSANHKQLKNEI